MSAVVAPLHPDAHRVKHAVMEVFGPTIQGEGPDAGRPCLFVRFGGCDFRCSWCDSMHAVDPAQVREHSVKLNAVEILERLRALTPWPRQGYGMRTLVVLSGGNPALQRAGALVDLLHEQGYDVSVETQGSIWRDWLHDVDRLVVSPKPPSSGMTKGTHPLDDDRLRRFMDKARSRAHVAGWLAFKVVVFHQYDLDWAISLHQSHSDVPFYLSVGTAPPDPGETTDEARIAVSERWRWLAEQVAASPHLRDARVLPQLHVLAWGHAQGV